jgi:uncharacterized protein YcfJ
MLSISFKMPPLTQIISEVMFAKVGEQMSQHNKCVGAAVGLYVGSSVGGRVGKGEGSRVGVLVG